MRPLFGNVPDKLYNLKKSTQLQRPIRRKRAEDTEELLEFGDACWMEEEERRQKEKLAKYERSLQLLLKAAAASEKGEISLEELKQKLEESNAGYLELIPNVQIFKEIMVELIQSKEIDIRQLQKERREYISERSGGFRLHEMLLLLSEQMEPQIQKIAVGRVQDGSVITFEHAADEDGIERCIRCSNVWIRVWQEA